MISVQCYAAYFNKNNTRSHHKRDELQSLVEQLTRREEVDELVDFDDDMVPDEGPNMLNQRLSWSVEKKNLQIGSTMNFRVGRKAKMKGK